MSAMRMLRAGWTGLVLFGLGGPLTATGESRIEIAPAEAYVLPEGAQVVGFVDDADQEAWRRGEPHFTITLPGDESVTARGWVGVTAETLLLHVVVNDDVNVNTFDGAEPTPAFLAGDRLLIGIDGLADGHRSVERRRFEAFPPLAEADQSPTMEQYRGSGGKRGPDDRMICAALTGQGPRVLYTDLKPGNQVYKWAKADQVDVAITRDEEAGATVYELAVRWSFLGVAAGVKPTFSLGVDLHDDDGPGTPPRPDRRAWWPVDDDREVIVDISKWARKYGPRRFGLFVFGPPKQAVAAAEVTMPMVWRPEGYGEITLAWAGHEGVTIEARMGETTRTMPIDGAAPNQEVQRLVVRGYPADQDGLTLSARLLSEDGQELAAQSLAMENAYREYQALLTRLRELEEAAEEPLFATHLRSFRMGLETYWRWSEEAQHGAVDQAMPRQKFAAVLRAYTEGDADEWQSYLDRKYPIIVSSEPDAYGIASWAQVWLPKDWTPGKSFPLIMEMEGTAHGHIMSFMQELHPAPIEVRAGDVNRLLLSELRGRYPYEYRPCLVEGKGYAARHAWQGSDRIALLDTLAEVLKYDPDRLYAYGHSHGGYAIYRPFVTRYPDRFAAVALSGMIGMPSIARDDFTWTRRGRDTSLFANAMNGPRIAFVMDPLEFNDSFRKEDLTWYGDAAGVDVEVMIHEVERRHDCDYWRFKRCTDWLLEQRRRRPTEWQYLSYGNRPGELGSWGIAMDPSEGYVRDDPETWAFFKAEREGNALVIETKNTKGLTLHLGASGDRALQMEGEVHVTVNGESAYTGPAETVRIDIR